MGQSDQGAETPQESKESKVVKYLKAALNYVMSFGNYPGKLAQMGHFLAGVVCADWFGYNGCAVFFGFWVCIKEIGLDPLPPENDPFLWGGAKDMAFYVLGMAVGLARRKYLGI